MDAVRYDVFKDLFEGYLEEYLCNIEFYKNMWSSSCWTVPSVGSLITGKNPLEHKAVLETACRLDEKIPTMYDYFHEKGYHNYYLSSNQMFNKTFLKRMHTKDVFVCNGKQWEYDEMLARSSKLFAKAKKSTDPFLFYIHFMDAHRPYPLLSDIIPPMLDILNNTNGWKVFYRKHITLDSQMLKIYKAMYVEGVKNTLKGVKGIFDMLKDRDDTCIVVLSDHGEMLGEHDLFDHQFNLYDECVKIPMLVFDKQLNDQYRTWCGLYSIQNVFDLVVKNQDIYNKEIYAYYSKPDRILKSQASEELLTIRLDLLKAIEKRIYGDGSSELRYLERFFSNNVGGCNEEKKKIEEKLSQLGYL